MVYRQREGINGYGVSKDIAYQQIGRINDLSFDTHIDDILPFFLM